MATKGLPEFSGLDILKALYSELSADVRPYFKTIVCVTLKQGGSYEETVVHTSEKHTKLETKGHRGAKRVDEVRSFEESTCGSLYAPLSALGYRQMDYEWALNFKVDCDLSRKKTGDIADGAVHYIADIAAGAHIIQRRETLESIREYNARGRQPSNYNDLVDRYVSASDVPMSDSDREEIKVWLDGHRDELDDENNTFKNDNFMGNVMRHTTSISAGPDDLDQESFLEWLLRAEKDPKRKPEAE